MSATNEQRRLLDMLDVAALLADVSGDLRAVITRIANRAKTADEADDLRMLIGCRGSVERARTAVVGLHPDHLDHEDAKGAKNAKRKGLDAVGGDVGD